VFDRKEHVEAIVALCRELATRGLNVGMSDARPAVLVRVKRMPLVHVTIDESGEFFEWDTPLNRHPISDPAGAAAQLAENVRERMNAEGDAS
jgi:hypothetical protein